VSITINLLPDLRQTRLREQRQRRLVTVITIMVVSISAGLVLLLFVFNIGQKVITDNLSKDITSKEKKLQNTASLVDALTAQQHIQSLPAVWAQRVYFTKFFDAYSQVNPNAVVLNSLSVTPDNLVTIGGNASSYKDVSQLADAMSAENVTLGTGASTSNPPYFVNVQIRSITSSSTGYIFSLTAGISKEVVSGN
jgi:Tfp pilus assembly protein PilN